MDSKITAEKDGNFKVTFVEGTNVYNRLMELFEKYEASPELMVNFTADKRTGEINDVYLINTKTGEKIY